ncbi:MAG: TlpA family protein disulfide reductase [Bacteroidales bacterium]|nr:TlpA family protein disulfide reductase [Bacteroidales bacterium]
MKNMSRFSKSIILSAVVLLAASCARTAKIDAVVADAPSSDVIVKLLDINRFETLDTVALDQTGHFSYKVDVKKGQPEFVYLFHGDTKIASMILKSGDKVTIETDTLGNYTVFGSEESTKLAEVERDYAKVLAKMNSIARRIEESVNADYALTLRQQLGKEYLDYYRSRIKYVMENSRSLSVVPVFYQTLGADLPVFAQATDAIHYRNTADSLALEYPDSKYVKALRQEADRRFGYLELESRLSSAESISYPDIELPDIKGQKCKLTDVDSKVVLLHFWTATDTEQKMFNLEVLKPLYNEFHSKGFEIYQVSLDVDKGLWAQVVKEQALPWISVCDSQGASSIYARTYNLSALPAIYIIANGELVDGSIVDEKSLRKTIKDNLR